MHVADFDYVSVIGFKNKGLTYALCNAVVIDRLTA